MMDQVRYRKRLERHRMRRKAKRLALKKLQGPGLRARSFRLPSKKEEEAAGILSYILALMMRERMHSAKKPHLHQDR